MSFQRKKKKKNMIKIFQIYKREIENILKDENYKGKFKLGLIELVVYMIL